MRPTDKELLKIKNVLFTFGSGRFDHHLSTTLMNKEELQKLSTEELKKKAQGTKTLIFIFIPIILGLIFFIVRDYFSGSNVDMPSLTIMICAVGGMVALFPELKKIQEVLDDRNT